MSTPIISVTDVRKSYGRGQNRFDALRGVSFDIHEGESVAIVGKSGSGKSTLMQRRRLLRQCDDGIVLVRHADRTPRQPALAVQAATGDGDVLLDRSLVRSAPKALLVGLPLPGGLRENRPDDSHPGCLR